MDSIDKTEYDFEIERIIREITDRKARFVGLQFPEGLKKFAVGIAGEIENRSRTRVVILTDPVYGACDTKETDAGMLGLDLMVHFGHTGFG